MAVISGGDTFEIAWSNGDLGSGFFFGIAGEAFTYMGGGYRGNDQAVLDGANRLIKSMNRMPWSCEGKVSNDMVNNNEFEAAQAIAASTTETTFTVSNANGTVYKGAGTILGDLELDVDKCSFTLKLVGGGNFTKQ